MPYFSDAAEVYANLGTLFEDVMADEELGARFRTANTIVQYRFRHPDSAVTVKMLEGEDAQVDLGPQLGDAELDLRLCLLERLDSHLRVGPAHAVLEDRVGALEARAQLVVGDDVLEEPAEVGVDLLGVLEIGHRRAA